MASAHTRLNDADETEARQLLSRCCGAQRWVSGMLALRPFASQQSLLEAADRVWAGLSAADHREAFEHHPQIGADLAQLREKFAATASWSSQEQVSVQAADESVLLALRDQNRAYLERFGYIFIVCASGKTAAEMLALLTARLHNEPAYELALAAAEQAKITRLRLEKLAV